MRERPYKGKRYPPAEMPAGIFFPIIPLWGRGASENLDEFKKIKIIQCITLLIYCKKLFLSYWMCKVIFAHSWHK